MSATTLFSPARATLLAITLCLFASGCTTIKAVKEVGRQAADGNLITAAYTATVGVAVAAIVDVVTLGGAVSPEEGMGLITAAAAASNGTPPPPTTPTSPAPRPSSASAASTSASAAASTTSTAARPAGSAASGPTVGARPDLAASECIRVVPPRSRLGYFRIENSCGHPVEVAYCATSRNATNSLCRARVHRTQAGDITAYHHARVVVGPHSGKDLPVEADADAVYAGACRTSFGDQSAPHLTGVAPITGATLVRCIGWVGPRDAPAPSAGTR